MVTGDSKISKAIKQEALRLGFTDCGFSKAEALPEDAKRLKAWLDRGYNARMAYMANHFEKRTNPTQLVEGARSVISLLYNYYTDKKQADPNAPVLSKYAYGKDYHLVMKDKMHQLFDLSDPITQRWRGGYLLIRRQYWTGHGHKRPDWDG